MSELFNPKPELPDNLPHYQLFTDGACLGNPGPGGWAYIVKRPGSDEVIEDFGGESNTTNNRMEMSAVIKGLQSITAPARVELIADSQYVIKGMLEWLPGWKARGWRTASKKPVKNVDLWQTLDELLTQFDLSAEWTKGHAGHPENERCDQLASDQAERIKQGF